MSVTMLTDALKSEVYRFGKNRTTLLWSIVFFPAVSLVLGLIGQMFIKSKMVEIQGAQLPPGAIGKLLAGGPMNLADSLVGLAGELANPMLLLFVLIGAATVYAGDYRWESWRLTTARNTRLNLILGKVGTVKLIALAALLLMLALGLIGEVGKAMIFARPLGFTPTADSTAHFGLLALIAYIRVVQVTLLGLLAAVVTRSLIATLFVPIVVSVAQAIFANFIPMLGWEPSDWRAHALFPGLSYDILKAAILQTPTTDAGSAAVWAAAIGLTLWCLVPLAAAIAWFSRQDLSKE